MGEQTPSKNIHPRQKKDRPKRRDPKGRKEEKQKERRKTRKQVNNSPTRGSNDAFFDIAGIDARVSHHPQFQEVGFLDPVGHSLLMSVSEVPSVACRAEDHDGVSLQSFSMKAWTFVSCFMPINSWSSAWVQGRAGSGGVAAGIA